ncbi:hypothetical protein PP212_gp47 [Streptococcus phage CHPC875]|uniref:Uncharacterized protein n=1 Tax=Streptococcus phage CHPC875 TaxID=2365043 RepID=A0A3G8F7E3_9CAUD|nr:hypothetical protein PP212_gp47 [Streptococcus phage CHPC875]AZF90701.1 hypothetical protein CHPC875_0047 [Streptococcus phage CHPC875]
MYWILISIKYLLGFVHRSVSDAVSKKLPSHDRLTASEGVEPSNATRIKMELYRIDGLRCYHLPYKATSLALILF